MKYKVCFLRKKGAAFLRSTIAETETEAVENVKKEFKKWCDDFSQTGERSEITEIFFINK